MTTRLLDGIRIVDMTEVWAGPMGSSLLGDLGAETVVHRNDKVSAGQVMSQRNVMSLMLMASANNYAQSLAAWAFGFA